MRWRCIRLKQNIPSKCPDSKPARSERRNATKRPDRESSVGRASARLCVENRRLRRAAVSRGPGDPRLIRDARKGWQSGVGGQDSLTRSFHGSARQTGCRLSRGLHLCAQTKGFQSPGLPHGIPKPLKSLVGPPGLLAASRLALRAGVWRRRSLASLCDARVEPGTKGL
jgi:hypothetical protein